MAGGWKYRGEDEDEEEDQQDIDSGNLDPAMFVPGLTPELIASIPVNILVAHHPDLSELKKTSGSSRRSAGSVTAGSSSSKPIANGASSSRMPGPVPGYRDYKISTVPPNGDEDDIEDDTEPTRTRDSLVDPQWDREDAARKKEKFGKLDCTVYDDGTSIRGDDKIALERAVRLICAFLWTLDVGDDLKDEKRNYQFWLTHFSWLLKRIAKKLELQFPILGWCTGHYKALKWIELHIKSHNQTAVAGEKKRQQKRKHHKTVGTSRTKAAKASVASSAGRTTKGQRQEQRDNAESDDTDDFVDVDEEDDEETPPQKKQKITKKAAGKSIKADKHSARSKKAAQDDTDGTFDDFTSAEEDEVVVRRATPAVKRALPNSSAAGSSMSASRDIMRKGKGIEIPSRRIMRDDEQFEEGNFYSNKENSPLSSPLHSTLVVLLPGRFRFRFELDHLHQLASAVATPSSTLQIKYNAQKASIIPKGPLVRSAAPNSSNAGPSSSNLSASIASFKSTWSDTLLPPRVDAIRAACPRFEKKLEELDLLRSTLTILEEAQNCGIDPRSDGDQDFIDWIDTLEDLTVTEEADEDELREQFGHRAVGRWDYHEPLASLAVWGSTKNACRLLSALLRIWCMARSQMEEAKQEGDALVHNHIRQVCDLINSAFKLPAQKAKFKKIKGSGDAQAQASQSTSQSQRGAGAKSSKASSKVSETRVRKLGQKRAIHILSLADIHVKDKKRAVDMLVTAWENGTIILSPAQLTQAELNEDIEGSVVPQGGDDSDA
ncbi:hypothetical protein OC844_005126 [Tilletia horrida]|nr:hypothetical protein OC844_005126 [Tilletia horrida]